MKRDPEKHYIKKKMDTIRVKKIYPRFFIIRVRSVGLSTRKRICINAIGKIVV